MFLCFEMCCSLQNSKKDSFKIFIKSPFSRPCSASLQSPGPWVSLGRMVRQTNCQQPSPSSVTLSPTLWSVSHTRTASGGRLQSSARPPAERPMRLPRGRPVVLQYHYREPRRAPRETPPPLSHTACSTALGSNRRTSRARATS